MVRGVHEIIFTLATNSNPSCILPRIRTKTFRSIPKVFLKGFSEKLDYIQNSIKFDDTNEFGAAFQA